MINLVRTTTDKHEMRNHVDERIIITVRTEMYRDNLKSLFGELSNILYGNKNIIEYSLLFFSLFEIGYLLTYYDGNFFYLFLSLYFNIVRCVYFTIIVLSIKDN